MKLHFDADTHTYTTEEGLSVPGVTDILGDLNIRKTGVYPPGAADRGKRIHSLLEYYDKRTLDWSTVTDEDVPIIEAWKTFSGVFAPWQMIEEVVFSQDMWYAGTLDRFDGDSVVDIKSGQEEKWHKLQIAAYAMAVGAESGFIVYIKEGAMLPIAGTEMEKLKEDWACIRKAWRWVKK